VRAGARTYTNDARKATMTIKRLKKTRERKGSSSNQNRRILQKNGGNTKGPMSLEMPRKSNECSSNSEKKQHLDNLCGKGKRGDTK